METKHFIPLAALIGVFSALFIFDGREISPVEARVPQHAAAESRPEYRHAVLRQGAYSAEEAQAAVDTDGVVRAHYAGLQLSKLKLTASSGKLMYASYRKNQRVYWTAKPVRVPKGEAVLSDGANLVRARCGNRLSESPQQPTETAKARDAEPIEEQLDQTLPRLTAQFVMPAPLDPPPAGYAGDEWTEAEGGTRARPAVAPALPLATRSGSGQGSLYYPASGGGGFGFAPAPTASASIRPPAAITEPAHLEFPPYPGAPDPAAPNPELLALFIPPKQTTISLPRSTTEEPGENTPTTKEPQLLAPAGLEYPPPDEPPVTENGVPFEPPNRTPENPLSETPEPSVNLLVAAGLLTVATARGARRLE